MHPGFMLVVNSLLKQGPEPGSVASVLLGAAARPGGAVPELIQLASLQQSSAGWAGASGHLGFSPGPRLGSRASPSRCGQEGAVLQCSVTQAGVAVQS